MKKIILLLFFGLLIVGLIISQRDSHVKRSETAIAWNPIAFKHSLDGQPENAKRIEVVLKQLKKQKLWPLVNVIEGREATEEELVLAHDKNYIHFVKDWAKNQNQQYLYHEKWTPYNSPYAYQSAATAAGALIQLTEAVAEKKYKNGFAMIRPPGHHAIKDKGMGYCLFNNISIATLNLLKKNLAHKILIVDIDAHHGNGVEDILKERSDVMYLSFHQEGMFPYTGKNNLSNVRNYNLNFLYPEKNYRQVFEQATTEALEQFRPDFIIVSSGYDGHWRDYMSNLGLSLNGYAWLSQKLVEDADKYTDGKIVFSLEGGYDPEVLAFGVTNSIKALLKRTDFIDPIGNAP